MPRAEFLETQRSVASSIDPVALATADSSGLCRIREVERLLDTLFSSWQSCSKALSARYWHRIGYEKPVVVTPLDAQTEEPDGASMVVMGCDISLAGFSFEHHEPLPCRKVAVSFRPHENVEASVVTRLTWCRFSRTGSYRSGGRFLRAVDVLVDENVDWNRIRPG